jgi:hypothetical protein
MLLDGFAAAAAAAAIASSPLQADHMRSVANAPVQSWQMLSAAKTEVREGLYGDYEVNVKEQEVDNPDSTFKSKEATEKGKVSFVFLFFIIMNLLHLQESVHALLHQVML